MKAIAVRRSARGDVIPTPSIVERKPSATPRRGRGFQTSCIRGSRFIDSADRAPSGAPPARQSRRDGPRSTRGTRTRGPSRRSAGTSSQWSRRSRRSARGDHVVDGNTSARNRRGRPPHDLSIRRAHGDLVRPRRWSPTSGAWLSRNSSVTPRKAGREQVRYLDVIFCRETVAEPYRFDLVGVPFVSEGRYPN